jgi:hypothetical protein
MQCRLTCRRGGPGADDATDALAWLPLHNLEAFPEVVRERHARNMERFRK